MAANKKWVLITLIFMAFKLSGQENQQKITIHFDQVSLEEALQAIDALPDLTLSYNPQSLPSSGRFTQSYVNVPVETILKDLLGEDYQIKQIGQYYIIQKKAKKEKQNVTLSGDVKDAETGQTLTDVTIYEVNTLNSTLSDDEGEFQLKVKSKSEIATFAISRKDYEDTIIQVQDIEALHQDIQLRPAKEVKSVSREEDKWIQAKKLVQFFTTRDNRKNTENVSSIQDRYFQASFVPAIGTNMTMGGQVRHKLSFNLLAGYSYGLDDGFELGGLYNIDRSDVSGAQIAGFGNTVGGKTSGIQIAGVLNTGRQYLDGTQIGGVANILTDSVSGVQLAGVFNISQKLDGGQIGGVINIANEVEGFQLSGVNNHSGDLKGIQLSGVINTARKVDGFQLSSVLNTAREVEGMQMSGFINTTQSLKGVQFGIINYADSASDDSFQIGLINLGRKNHLLEFGVEYSDVIPWRLSLRTGNTRFYVALSAGTQFEETSEPETLWSYGIGAGSKMYLFNSKFFFNPEIHNHQLILHNNNDHEYINLLNKLHLNLGYQFFNHLSITGGPALNIYITDFENEDGTLGFDIAKKPLYDEMDLDSNTRVQMWVGYQVAIRF